MRSRLPRIVLCVALLALGCGGGDSNSTTGFSSGSGTTGIYSLRLLDSTPTLAFRSLEPIRTVVAVGFGADGRQTFGPDRETYDSDITFAGFSPDTTRVYLGFEGENQGVLASYNAPVNFLSDDDGQLVINDIQPVSKGPQPPFTVKIKNGSDYPDDQVFVVVLGKDKDNTAYSYLNMADHGLSCVSQNFGLSDAATSATTQFALNSLVKESDHVYSFQCPRENLYSGRIYLAFGSKLKQLGLSNLNDKKSLTTPSATGEPDSQSVFEFMELSATIPETSSINDPDAVYTLFINTSVVDFFSLGLNMQVDYTENNHKLSRTVGFVDGARDKVLNAFKTQPPAEFQNFIYRQDAKKQDTAIILRVFSPALKSAIDGNGATAHFLDSVINSNWEAYKQKALNIDDSRSFAYGYKWASTMVNSSDILSMKCIAKPAGDTETGDLESLNEVCNLSPPSTKIVFFCDDPDALGTRQVRDSYKNEGSDGHKRLCSLISAALNRGVFDDYTTWDQGNKYFQRLDKKYNHYTKILHDYALDGKVYGFGYDDVFGSDPTIAKPLNSVSGVTLIIPRFPVLNAPQP